MTVNNILNKYSKEVIVEWITNRYPIFFIKEKDLKKELDEAKSELEFKKIDTELKTLFEEQKKLREKPFNETVMLKMDKNRKRIHLLLEEEDKILNLT